MDALRLSTLRGGLADIKPTGQACFFYCLIDITGHEDALHADMRVSSAGIAAFEPAGMARKPHGFTPFCHASKPTSRYPFLMAAPVYPKGGLMVRIGCRYTPTVRSDSAQLMAAGRSR